ncbi:MAG: hydroxyisourate hydrolase [Gemmatimonadaceae bacterium]|nr:hydroxyisourate hydrolase [Gemmatimonadaceae bacterium]
MSTLSTHVLDISLGRPAQGIKVTLEQGADIIRTGVTDADGRVPEIKAGGPMSAGVYRLRFLVAEYFAGSGRETFYTEITVNFRIGEGEHYHVPLLVSPFGYSTYRGS